MQFLRYVIYAAMLAEAVLMVMPSGGMKKYVKLSAALLMMIMLITPLISCEPQSLFEGIFLEERSEAQGDKAGKLIAEAYNDMLENTNKER